MGKAYGMMACTTLVAVGLWLTNGGETSKTAKAGVEFANTPPRTETSRGTTVGYSPAIRSERSSNTYRPSGAAIAVRGQSPEANTAAASSSSGVSAEKRQATELLRSARQDIQAGRYDQARQKALEAQALPVEYSLYDDKPRMVLNEIERRNGSMTISPNSPVVNAAASQVPGQTQPIQPAQFAEEFPTSGSPDKQKAIGLLREARQEMKAGNYVAARDKALAAIEFDVDYGLLEDRPEMLLDDLDRMVSQLNVAQQPTGPSADQAHTLVRDARRALNAGQLDEAFQKATAAQKLEVTYNVLDDRPEAVLDDIDRAMAGQPGNRTNTIADAAPKSNPFANRPATSNVTLGEARALVRDARFAMEAGRYEEAWNKAVAARELNAAFDVFEDRPELILGQLEQMQTAATPKAPETARMTAYSSYAESSDPTAQAQLLVREARQALESGQIDVARQKALMADKLNATFGPIDDRPELVLSEIAQMEANPGRLNSAAFEPNRSSAAPIAKASNISPIYPASMTADQLYDAGLAQMTQGNYDAAREAFLMAYRSQEQLEPRRRQHLQDFLRELSPKSSTTMKLVSSQELGSTAPGTIDLVEQQRAIQYDRLRSEVMNAIFRAERLKETDPDQAGQVLDQALANVENSDLGEDAAKNLVSNIRRTQASISSYKEQQAPLLAMKRSNQETLDSVRIATETRVRIEQELATLVEEYNKLIDERRYHEAEVVAKQAKELDPENPVSVIMVEKARIQRHLASGQAIKEQADEGFLGALEDVDKAMIIGVRDDKPMVYDPKRWEDIKGRKDKYGADNAIRTETEKKIDESLLRPVSLHFEEAPLSEVMKHVSSLMGISVVVDVPGLSEVGVESSQPISIDVDGIMLKSALNLMLEPLTLGYSVDNEVLNITNQTRQQGKMILRTYPVADLVVPLGTANPTIFQPNGFMPQSDLDAGNNSPMMGAMPTVNPLGGLQFQVADNGTGMPGLNDPWGNDRNKNDQLRSTKVNFAELTDLITRTVQPDTWDEFNGNGSVMSSETTLSLVIRQTQKVHDDIADLLGQLRRLQDLQVTLEVRFVIVTDDFYERIGVDFDFNLQDTVNETQDLPAFGSPSTGTQNQNQNQQQNQQQAATTNTFDPNPFAKPALDAWRKPTIVGLSDSEQNFTDDLDVGFRQGSFDIGIPEFGGFQSTAGAQVGFAILSDIEAFFFIQAAQGNRRTNTMFAPKVTLFNGQAASVSDFAARPFVVGYEPVVGFGSVGFQPIVRQIPDGLNVGVAAVISADRRYVRLSVSPQFTSITEVSTFSVPTGSAGGVIGQVGGQVGGQQGGQQGNNQTGSALIQLPVTEFVNVLTTVSVPDGGTVLLGGVKRLREGRNMSGVPILNKLPYVSRLFKNTGVGRETESLLLLVTPRIIVQEEEEELLGLPL